MPGAKYKNYIWRPASSDLEPLSEEKRWVGSFLVAELLDD